jgi:hypothetical protein
MYGLFISYSDTAPYSSDDILATFNSESDAEFVVELLNNKYKQEFSDNSKRFSYEEIPFFDVDEEQIEKFCDKIIDDLKKRKR